MRDGMREVELIVHGFVEDSLVISGEGSENGEHEEDDGVRMSVFERDVSGRLRWTTLR